MTRTKRKSGPGGRGRRVRNPAELVIMAANPGSNSPQARLTGDLGGPTRKESAAGDLYERFHGESPKHVDEYHEPSPRPATLTELGDLLELRLKRVNGWKWGSLDFTGQGIKVASNAAGRQLYLVGGQQKLTRGQLTSLGVDNSKDLIDLGEARYIAYRAKKQQVNGIAADYEHGLGEETGVGPRLIYDRRGPEPRILFSGGEYHIEGVGIVN